MRGTIINHSSLAGIKQSYQKIGELCGVGAEARARLADLATQEAAVRSSCASSSGSQLTRVLVVVGRTREGSESSGVYVSGKDGFYSELLNILSAQNVNSEITVSLPALSSEGIVKLNPDVIIEIVNTDDGHVSPNYSAFWRRFSPSF